MRKNIYLEKERKKLDNVIKRQISQVRSRTQTKVIKLFLSLVIKKNDYLLVKKLTA